MPDGDALVWTDERIAFERQVLAVFERVLDAPADEQHAVIDAECGSNDKLRSEVLALLDRQPRSDTATGIFAYSATDFVAPIVRELHDAIAIEIAGAPDIAAALLPRYVLHGELGRGGHAIVFRAHDCSLNRGVAIKIARRERASEDASRRFTQEIAIAARLQHPFIVPLLDSGTINGRLYFVMPIVKGESLRERLDREGALEVAPAIAVANDIAEALDHAHAQKVVHRDVKPRNVLLREGHAHLTDFGIALALHPVGDEGDGRMTAPGTSIGTPSYMSPEQTVGSRVLDQRTDVYALACVCFEMLTGEVPYAGTGAATVQAKHRYAPIPDARMLRPMLPDAVSRVLMRGMAKAPEERFTTAGEFVSALKRAASAPDVTPPASVPSSKRRLMFAAGALLVVAAALGIARALAR